MLKQVVVYFHSGQIYFQIWLTVAYSRKYEFKYTKVISNGWCATSANNQFEPITIGFYDESLATQLANEAELDKMICIIKVIGMLDIQLLGNTSREAKIFSKI